MRAHELLLKKIDESVKLSDELSENEHDVYARCTEALMIALETIKGVSRDRSAECKCDCHTGKSMHCVPCGCYSGNPTLDE